MTKEVKNVPVLRFPEFKDEWELKESRELFGNSRQKGNQNLPVYAVTQDRGLVPRETLDRNISNDAAPDSNLYVGPDYLAYNMMRMWQGAVGIATKECMVSPAYIVLKPKINTFSTFFINFFQRKRSLYLLWAYSYGLTNDRLRLYYKDFSKIAFHTPILTEQKQIASFLSAIDKKIEQLTRKKELLEQYKKGVMQKIFSQEIRFKDDNGQDYPDWEEKRFGDVISFHPTNSLSRSDLNYDEGNIYNIHYGDIHKSFRTQFDIDRETVPFISNDNETKKLKQESFCNPGDLIIADASEDYADIGKVIEIWNVSGKKVVAGLHTFLGRDITSETVVGFKGYLFQTSLIRKQIYRIAQGISVLGISKKNVLDIQIGLPHKGEQVKIVSMLSSIDNKINTIKTQLTHTQNFKKGLLQKMFV